MSRKPSSFMKDRYGTDELNYFILFLGLTFTVLSFILSGFRLRNLLLVLNISTVLLFLIYYLRMFSKNIRARKKELRTFQNIYYRITHFFHTIHKNLLKKEKYEYIVCQNCRKMYRIKKGKANKEHICPECEKIKELRS